MSFFLADVTGPLDEFASIGGMADFREWALEHKGPVADFVKHGFTEELTELAEALQKLSAPELIAEQRDLLIKNAKVAQHILIVSDGLGHEEPRTAARRNTDNRPIHRAADANLVRMTVAVQYAFMIGRKAINKELLKNAKSELDAMSAMDHAPLAVKAALLKALPPVLARCYVAGLETGTTYLRTAAQIKTRFDVTDPDAVAWAKEHAAELADAISETTRDEIRDAILNALDGDGLESALEDLFDAVGDEARAELIARTEIMTASNKGQREGWSRAVDKGLLTGDEKRVWIATSDACDDCQELDGETTSLDGNYPNDGEDGPPLHPNCRCTEGLTEGEENDDED